MREKSTMYKEKAEAIESFEKKFSDAEYEEETGMPAISQHIMPADGSLPPQ